MTEELIGVVGTLITALATIVAALFSREQRRQKREIDGLSFLLAHFLPRWEFDHLQKLARNEALAYDKERYPGFEQEVRQLRDRDLIVPKKDGFRVSNLPSRGTLQEYYKLSRDGETYLELRKQIEAKKQATKG